MMGRLELLDRASNPDHFAVLGVAEDANDEQIKKAYFLLVRQVHPDMVRITEDGLREASREALVRVGAAWEVLRNRHSREAYRSERRIRRILRERYTPPPVDRFDVDSFLDLAAERLREEKFWDVIRILEPILPSLGGQDKVRASVVLATAFAKNPKWTFRAAEVLENLLVAYPHNRQVIEQLADIYDAAGMTLRAKRARERKWKLN